MTEDEEPQKPKGKTGKLVGRPGQPLEFQEVEDSELLDVAGISFPIATGEALFAYLKEAQNLLKGKYVGQKELAPPHMRVPCDIFVVRCKDGIFVRYDKQLEGRPTVRCAAMDQSLKDLAPMLSERLVHFPDDPSTYPLSDDGPAFILTMIDPDGKVEEISRTHPVIFAKTTFPDDSEIPLPPARPPCLLSILNEFDMQMGGFVEPTDNPTKSEGKDVQQFIVHSRFRIPAGWEAIEVYPLLGDEYWNIELAPTWAELDLLAAIARRNLIGNSLTSLDNRGASRKVYAALLDEFEELLAGPEEPVHQFLKLHPELLCPTHDRFWSKLPFGDRVSDFVFREAYNDYQLVEIEAPHRLLFRKDGQQRAELTHAINQTAEWIEYIGNNKQKVEEELGLEGISTNPRSLVVIGRSESLTEENRLRLVTLQTQHSKLQILTYDDVIANARANLERLFGPLGIVAVNAELYFFK